MATFTRCVEPPVRNEFAAEDQPDPDSTPGSTIRPLPSLPRDLAVPHPIEIFGHRDRITTEVVREHARRHSACAMA
jgi:hypothetical protein